MAVRSGSRFGSFAKKARLAKGLGLRQAAREMSMPAAYLSRVENNVDAPSGLLIHRMSALYEVPIEELTVRWEKTKTSGNAYGHDMQAIPELRALYRLGKVDPDLIENVLRKVLLEKGTPEEDVEKEIAKLKLELPRVRNSGGDGLFAAEVKPRFLSKGNIANMADQLLERNGFSQQTYVPPTPIEMLVDNEPEISYRIDALKCDKRGSPLVLGLTGWDSEGRRQIVINSVLADSSRTSDEHRFNFTLAHELFHALEHLPRLSKQTGTRLARMQVFVSRESPAERAVTHWTKTIEPRRFTTDEDWREWQANSFASAILMPGWAVRAEFRARIGSEAAYAKGRMSLREAALELASDTTFESKKFDSSLGDLFAVSRQAMAIRILQLGLLREGTG